MFPGHLVGPAMPRRTPRLRDELNSYARRASRPLLRLLPLTILLQWPTPSSRRPSTRPSAFAPSRRCSTGTLAVRPKPSRRRAVATGSHSCAGSRSSSRRWRSSWLGGKSPDVRAFPSGLPSVRWTIAKAAHRTRLLERVAGLGRSRGEVRRSTGWSPPTTVSGRGVGSRKRSPGGAEERGGWSGREAAAVDVEPGSHSFVSGSLRQMSIAAWMASREPFIETCHSFSPLTIRAPFFGSFHSLPLLPIVVS